MVRPTRVKCNLKPARSAHRFWILNSEYWIPARLPADPEGPTFPSPICMAWWRVSCVHLGDLLFLVWEDGRNVLTFYRRDVGSGIQRPASGICPSGTETETGTVE